MPWQTVPAFLWRMVKTNIYQAGAGRVEAIQNLVSCKRFYWIFISTLCSRLSVRKQACWASGLDSVLNEYVEQKSNFPFLISSYVQEGLQICSNVLCEINLIYTGKGGLVSSLPKLCLTISTKAYFSRPAATHILRKALLEPSCLPEPMKITAYSLATLHLLGGAWSSDTVHKISENVVAWETLTQTRS